MSIYSLWYSMRQVFVSLRRNIGLSLITAVMVAISLMAVGGFLMVAINIDQIFRNVESTLEISVFLYGDADVQGISAKLDENINVESYVFVSRDQGLEEFGLALGNTDILNDLSGVNNPLPDLFRVRARSADFVPALAQEFQSYAGVELADYGRETLNSLMRATEWVRIFVMGVSLLLAVGAIFLIVTIIKLSVMARQEEISIMKYLGASNWFVRFPFIFGGMLICWLGTIFSIAFVGVVYFRVAESLRMEALAFFLQPVVEPERIIPIFIGMMILGTFMGAVGSYISVRKFLRA